MFRYCNCYAESWNSRQRFRGRPVWLRRAIVSWSLRIDISLDGLYGIQGGRTSEMQRSRRRTKPQFWMVVIFFSLLAYALIADWWKEHAVLGWTIVGVAAATLAFCIYRFPAFRSLIFGTVKKAAKGVVYEPEGSMSASGRDALKPELREYVLGRADARCENLNCTRRVPLKIHHIDGNRNHNVPKNLIALCGTCHDLAEMGEYPPHQLKSWVWKSQQRRKWQSDRASRAKSRR